MNVCSHCKKRKVRKYKTCEYCRKVVRKWCKINYKRKKYKKQIIHAIV